MQIKGKKEQFEIMRNFKTLVRISSKPVDVICDYEHMAAKELVKQGLAKVVKKKQCGRIAQIKGKE